jgi:hypothetical protein
MCVEVLPVVLLVVIPDVSVAASLVSPVFVEMSSLSFVRHFSSNCPFHSRHQAVPALRYLLLKVTGPSVLRRFSPATTATSHMSSCYHSGHLPRAHGGTDRLIREGWGKKLGCQQAYLHTLQLGKYSGGEYRDPAGLLSCGRGGLRLRVYWASLRQDGKKVMLTTIQTFSDSRVFNRGLLCLYYSLHCLRTT